ncbi:hypothetical protein QEO94_10245 [Kingella negevensis]|uniref:hypothetical protein n=1 Tax=Kingella negevensis TaxID=1522312 RepID=UPI0025430B42|nr:hypothetical protein [Kingella negevensis]WII92991.1 hypothetical protein QEO94_10245 [Kingella negevensis]
MTYSTQEDLMRLMPQRRAASQYLQQLTQSDNGDSISYAFLVIPKDWKDNPPPESVLAALRNSGYELHWLAVADSVPAMMLLPSAEFRPQAWHTINERELQGDCPHLV